MFQQKLPTEPNHVEFFFHDSKLVFKTIVFRCIWDYCIVIFRTTTRLCTIRFKTHEKYGVTLILSVYNVGDKSNVADGGGIKGGGGVTLKGEYII